MENVYKNQLQNYAQRRNLTFPTYSYMSEGPPHANRFKCKVTFHGRTYETQEFFRTIKEAKQRAAKVALMSLSLDGIEEHDDSGLYKNLIQELAQKEGYALPIYNTTQSGVHYIPTFVSTVEVGQETFLGQEEKKKKLAEMSAAKVAWMTLKERKPNGRPLLSSHAHGEPANYSSSNLQANVITDLHQNVRPSDDMVSNPSLFPLHQAEEDKGSYVKYESERSMLSVLHVHLPSDIPIVGCQLMPYILLRRPNKTVTADDVPESSPIDGHCLRYKWYRIQSDRKVAVCSVHPSEQATLQCLGCVKAKIHVAKSYHCSPKCFLDAWQHHRVLHDRAASAVNENGNEEEVLFGRFNSSNYGVSFSGSASSTSLTDGSTPLYPAVVTQRSGGETWFEVGRSKTYTPMADDIGHVLKFECVVVDLETKLPIGHPSTIMTSRVIPAPFPRTCHWIPVNGVDVMGHLDSVDV